MSNLFDQAQKLTQENEKISVFERILDEINQCDLKKEILNRASEGESTLEFVFYDKLEWFEDNLKEIVKLIESKLNDSRFQIEIAYNEWTRTTTIAIRW